MPPPSSSPSPSLPALMPLLPPLSPLPLSPAIPAVALAAALAARRHRVGSRNGQCFFAVRAGKLPFFSATQARERPFLLLRAGSRKNARMGIRRRSAVRTRVLIFLWFWGVLGFGFCVGCWFLVLGWVFGFWCWVWVWGVGFGLGFGFVLGFGVWGCFGFWACSSVLGLLFWVCSKAVSKFVVRSGVWGEARVRLVQPPLGAQNQFLKKRPAARRGVWGSAPVLNRLSAGFSTVFPREARK